MLKVLLILSVFTGGDWESLGAFDLNTDGTPFTLETCTAAAAQWLGNVRDKKLVDHMVPAVSADCRMGLDQSAVQQ